MIGIHTRYLLVAACLLLLACSLPLRAAENLVTSAQADLDGDGKKEIITINKRPDHPTYTLHVGRKATFNKRAPKDDFHNINGFLLVDIDRKDHYQEIAVQTTDGSDTTYHLYWYNGTTITPMAELSLYPTFPGNGTVLVDHWKDYFWMCRDIYTLTSTHHLTLTPQPFYYVGQNSPITGSLPLYANQQGKALVTTLPPKTIVKILLNQGDWYLLKTSSGLTGWVPAKKITMELFPDLTWGG